jgi:signal transduction histidine kinase
VHHLVTPAIVAKLAFASVLAVAGLNLLVDLDADLAVAVTYDLAVILVAVGLCAALVRAPWTDDTLADLVTELGSPQDTRPSLEWQLRRVLGDPAFTIGYWSAERRVYLDEKGQPLEEDASPGRATTVVSDGGRPVALLVHDATLRDNRALLSGATAAVQLAVGNTAMRRDARARVARLAEARRRMVEVADSERLALSLRLDQGPQAHLRGIGDLLETMGSDGCADIDTVRSLRIELDRAQKELHELAHGVRPPTLTEGGLGTALPALAAGCPVPTAVSVDVGRLAPATEAALYFFCAEALANAAKHSYATRVRVTVRAEEATVVAEVVDDGVGGADPRGSGLRGLADRIEALGGTLAVAATVPHGVRLAARVPAEGELAL